jgi:hypothetical protein
MKIDFTDENTSESGWTEACFLVFVFIELRLLSSELINSSIKFQFQPKIFAQKFRISLHFWYRCSSLRKIYK